MAIAKKQTGQIIIPSGVNVWAHELKTAQALTATGLTVEFIRKGEGDRERSADVYISRVKWEFKAPTGNSKKVIERNLKKARWQSGNVVFDSRRMKKLPDVAIQQELSKRLKEMKGLNRILFIKNV